MEHRRKRVEYKTLHITNGKGTTWTLERKKDYLKLKASFVYNTDEHVVSVYDFRTKKFLQIKEDYMYWKKREGKRTKICSKKVRVPAYILKQLKQLI